jgi:hypothetical protein
MTPDQAQKVVRDELWRRVFQVVVVTSLIATLSLLLYLMVQSAGRGKENHELLTRVTSCTTPGGDCYQRGQSNTGAAVATINKVVILTASCATHHPEYTTVELTGCVTRHLASFKTPK